MRPSWDAHYMKMAEHASEMSTCLSRKVGAVAVKDKRMLATGFNGAPMRVAHCGEIGGCIRKRMGAKSGEMLDICRAVHAEANVIDQAAFYGISLNGATLYVNTKPCLMCEKQIINCGIKRVVYSGDYPHSTDCKMLHEAGVEVIHFKEGEPHANKEGN